MFPTTQPVPGSRRRTKTGGPTGRMHAIWTVRKDAGRPSASVVDRVAVLVIAELGHSRSPIR